MKQFTPINHHLGFSLIELMIVVTITLLILSILLKIFMVSEQSYHLQLALNQIQNQQKKAIHILRDEIHQAGYIGCAKLTKSFPMKSNLSFSILPQNKLIGGDTSLTIRHASFPPVTLQKMLKDDVTLYVNNETKFTKNDVLIIADCHQAEIFKPANIIYLNKSQKIIASLPLKHQFTKYAEISRLEINTFFIAKTKRKNQRGEFINSLFKKNIRNKKIELVEGINELKFSYLLQVNDQFFLQKASRVNDWHKVKGVEVEISAEFSPLKKTWYLYANVGERLR